MRIVLHDYGAYSFIFALARCLAEHGDEVLYIFSATEAPKTGLQSGVMAGANLKIIPLSIGRPMSKSRLLERRRHDRLYGRALATQLIHAQPDVVICANTPLDVLAIVQPALAKGAIKSVNWLQDIQGLAITRVLRARIPVVGSLIGYYYKRIEKKLVRMADALIVPSPDFVSELQRSGYTLPRTFVRPNWMPVHDFPSLPKVNGWSEKMGLAETTNVCYFGTLGYKQDLGSFLAIARHLRTYPDARLVMTADGASVAELERRLREDKVNNVLLLPWQDYKWYQHMLATADVLVSVITADASVFSVPSKILGYLCAERPVLAVMPESNMAARMLVNDEMGLVVSPGDLRGLASALDRLLAQDSYRQRLAKNARTYAEEHFKIEPIFRQFKAMLQAICDTPIKMQGATSGRVQAGMARWARR